MLGTNIHQSAELGIPITLEGQMGWLRVDFNWLQIEPSQGTFDFALFDAIVDDAAASGLEVLAVLAYGPAWASQGDLMGDGSTNDVPDSAAWAAFVSATVSHFQGRITHYELWNEPNLDVFFEGQPADYVGGLLLPGADAVHAACPECQVVAPGLATVGDEYDVWMDASLAAGKDVIDIVSGHVYAGFHSGTTSDNFFQKLEQHRVLYVGDTVVYEGPLALKEVMDAHGVTAPFWMTETGYEAPPGDPAELEAQDDYVRHVLEAQVARPWWTGTIWYEAFDNTGFTWGLATPEGAGYAPKPALARVAKVATMHPAFGGSGKACENGLDDDGDDLADVDEDPDCLLGDDDNEAGPSQGGGGAGGGSPLGGEGGAGAPGAAGPSTSGCGCRVGAGERAGSARGAALALGLLALARLFSPHRRRRQAGTGRAASLASRAGARGAA